MFLGGYSKFNIIQILKMRMKKFIITQVLLLLFSTLLSGQTHFGLTSSLIFASGDIIQPSLTNALETPKDKNKFVSGKAGLSLTSRISPSFLFMPEINFINTPADIRDKYQYFTEADMHKLTAAGYNKPFYALEDGVKEYVNEFLKGTTYY